MADTDEAYEAKFGTVGRGGSLFVQSPQQIASPYNIATPQQRLESYSYLSPDEMEIFPGVRLPWSVEQVGTAAIATAFLYGAGALAAEGYAAEGGALSGGEITESLGIPPPSATGTALGGELDPEWWLSAEAEDMWDDLDFSELGDLGDFGDGGDGGGDWAGIGDSIPDVGPLRNVMGGGGGRMMPVQWQGPVIAGAAAAGRTLWGVLRSGGSRVVGWFRAPSGVRARMQDLWPAARQYGLPAVATALGIGVAELGQMLAQAPTHGGRKRRRGISAANIRTAKRVIRFNRQLSRQLGTGGRGRSRGRYYAPRRSRRYAYC